MSNQITFRPLPPRLPTHAGKSLAARFVWQVKSEGGPCEQGQTVVETGCVPASGEGQKKPTSKKVAKQKPVDVLEAKSKVTENGVVFETGKPVTFQFLRNTESSSKHNIDKSKFGISVEPAGRYLLHNSADVKPSGNWETGTVSFKNPIVLELTTDDQIYGPNGWKQRLSNAYGGKTGKALSKAIAKDGYDGIVTTVGADETREIVDLTWALGNKPEPPQIKSLPSNKPAPPTAKPGFTGKRKEGEREICRKDGKVVPCAPGESDGKEKTQAEPGKQANPAGAAPQGQGNDQGVGNKPTDFSDPKFAAEWAKEIEKHIDEIEKGNVTDFDFSPEQVAAEQDWHAEFIEWRWGLGKRKEGELVNAGKVQISPADVGPASRFISGLLNALTGGPQQAAKLKQMIPKDQQKEQDAQSIGSELQAFFDGMAPGQDNREAAELVSQVIGPQAVAIAKVLSGGQKAGAEVEKPEATPALTNEVLAGMTPAERSEAVAAEREARTPPKKEEREAAARTLSNEKVGHEGARGTFLDKRRGQIAKQKRGKERNRQAETDEERIAREAIEADRLKKRRAAQEARMEKYRAQDRKKAEREAKKATGKKGQKTLSWLNESSGGALVAPPAHPFAPKPSGPKIKKYKVGQKVLWWR